MVALHNSPRVLVVVVVISSGFPRDTTSCEVLVVIPVLGISGFPRDEHTLTGVGIETGFLVCEARIVVCGHVCAFVQILGSHSLMMCVRVMFAEVVGVILVAGFPENVELALFGAVPKPV